MKNHPVFRESVEVFFLEGHGFPVYFYILAVLAPVEFLSLYIPSLDAQMWSGSANLFKVCSVTALLLLPYFGLRVANQEFAPWRFRPAKHWMRDGKIPVASFCRAQLSFLALHVSVSLVVCAPLLIWAGAIARTGPGAILTTLLLLWFYGFTYAIWGLAALARWERKPETRQVFVRSLLFAVLVGSALLYLPLNPVGFVLAYLSRQELAPLAVGPWKWPGAVVHFGFHAVLFGAGLATYLWSLKRKGEV
ncbi:MAG TPA: hypothetical protein VNN77_07520 [candidate division Zixibacteria bacterium]|nr:hypothetical protein [candidate division Zixibacteria bacterium]